MNAAIAVILTQMPQIKFVNIDAAMTGGDCGKCGDFAANAANILNAAFAAISPHLPQKPPVIAVRLFDVNV